MNIAIIDDEIHCIESLVLHIDALYPDAKIVYKTNKVHEALEKLPKLTIELLLLDIEMPGMNGFQLLEQLEERNFDVIFTTAYSHYAVQAFKAQAIDYLLKPIDDAELKETIDKWINSNKLSSNSQEQINELLEYLKKEGVLKTKIVVPVSDGYEFIEAENIMYCNSSSNYTTLYLSNGREILISRTLKEVENTLQRFYFIRVHQSYLINPNYLQKFSRNDGGLLIMENNEQIPVSNPNKKLIMDLFEAIKRKT